MYLTCDFLKFFCNLVEIILYILSISEKNVALRLQVIKEKKKKKESQIPKYIIYISIYNKT